VKQLFAILSIIAISSGLFVKTSLMINYAVQFDKYNELCENKDKPQLECHGSCQLSKEIASIGSQETPPELTSLTEYFTPVFYQEKAKEVVVYYNSVKLLTSNFTLPRCCVTNDIDHPPQIA
jgi:hypothetical protein